MTDNQTLPVSQEARVEQRHRDLAGELWGDCGFVEPEPHDGTIAAVLETIAITFARFEQQILTRERNTILEEAAGVVEGQLMLAHDGHDLTGFSGENATCRCIAAAIRSKKD